MHDHHHHHHHEHGSEAAHPHTQHVVLDVGGGFGALVVHTDPELLGKEVEISPSGNDGQRAHKEVLERVTAGGSSHVLVFDDLPEGSYTLWLDGVALARDAHVADGVISELDCREGR